MPNRPNSLFSLACLVVLAASCLLGGRLLVASYDELRTRQDSLQRIDRLAATLTIMNRASTERGPTNALLGTPSGEQDMALSRLAAFRTLTDSSLSVVRALDHANADQIEDITARLGRARAMTDALAALPLPERSVARLRELTGNLFRITAGMQDLADKQIAPLLRQDSPIATLAVLSITLSNLREQAGRMNSILMPFVVTGEAPTPEVRSEIERMRGRLVQLRKGIATQIGGVSEDPAFLVALGEVDQTFFEEGLPLLDAVIADQSRTGRFALTMEVMTDRYMPTMRPLEALRDLALHRMAETSRARRDAAWRWVLLAVGVTGAVLVLQGAILAGVRTRVFRPLMRAHDEILAMASGAATQGRGLGARPAGLRSLFRALDVLAARLRELRRVEIEREALSAQLRLEADTDALTGLLNRRAMERIAAGRGPMAQNDPLGAILIDLDHFKAVNDGHGHAAGDQVLRHVAAVLGAQLRADSVVGRFGGEEFLVLLPEGDPDRVRIIAERCRAALASRPVPLPGGAELRVTASFGVATGRCGTPDWQDLVRSADVALYQAKRAGRNRVGPLPPASPELRASA